MTKFRKKPVVIEAVRWTGDNETEISDFCSNDDLAFQYPELTCLILTPEGIMTASNGDWIIRGIKGEFYPCKPDIFNATYEEVKEEE